jgi:predicted dehydrogenase/nucleoside-diphosphate-sugar epimerase
MRVAFVGTGFIADWHLKSLRALKRPELVAVCDKNTVRAESFAERSGAPTRPAVYGDLDTMLSRESLDAVHVLVPPEIHHRVAKPILEKGVSAFLEKPMCTNVGECESLIATARDKNVRLGVGHNFLFHPAYEALARDVRSGVLGKIDLVTIQWSKELGQITGGPFDGWLFDSPENVILEIGPHSAAHLLDLIGAPDSIEVRAQRPISLPNEKVCYRRWIVLATKGDVAAELVFSFLPGFSEHSIHVRGTLASATADFERYTYTLDRHTALSDDFDRFVMLSDKAKGLVEQASKNLSEYVLTKAKLSHKGNQYGLSITESMRAFYDALEQRRAVDPRISGEMGRDAVALAIEIGKKASLPKPASRPRSSGNASELAKPSILVLGGSGFIGLELLRQLATQKLRPRVLARSVGRLAAFDASEIEIARGDLENESDLLRAIDGVKTVVHLARAHVKTWSEYQRHEIEATRRIGEACRRAGVERLVYTGTIDSYYAGKDAGTITEATPLDPQIEHRNLYARAKAVSEGVLQAMPIPLVILRPGIVIGRGGSPFHFGVGMWMHNSVCQIWGDGTNPLPFVLVEDVGQGILRAIERRGIDAESFNLVGDPCLSALDYLKALEDYARIQVRAIPTPIARFYVADMFKYSVKVAVRWPERRMPAYRDWESRTQRAQFDCTKAKARLGWAPVAGAEALIRRGIHIPVDEFLR